MSLSLTAKNVECDTQRRLLGGLLRSVKKRLNKSYRFRYHGERLTTNDAFREIVRDAFETVYMATYTDEQVAEACAVLSKDHNARQTLVEMWAGKRRSVFTEAVKRLADKIGGTHSIQEGTTSACIYLTDNKRVMVDLKPVKNTFGMLDVLMLMQDRTFRHNAGPAETREAYKVHQKFSEELSTAFPSDQLVSELFLMKEFAE